MRQKTCSRSILVTATLLAGLANAGQEAAIEIDVGGAAPIRPQRHDHATLQIDIDGRLDEPVWAGIEPIGDLRVVQPDTLATPAYGTDLRIFYTERGIFVSFDMEQPQDTIVQRFVPRDEFDINRDNVGFTLDTSGDGRYGYWMNLSLGDSEMDGTVLPEREYGSDWDGAWYGATRRTATGWVAEFYVPWSQMAMPRTGGLRRIGVYVSRKVAHLDERWGWPGLANTQPRFMSVLQPLELDAVNPRQQWSLFPYLSGTADRVEDDQRFKAGADLFWRPSTNFQLTATVNPDFGSVEADNVVVNLTADETFFPEKRLFFLEGQQIFDTSAREGGGRRQPLTIVNTRRIGGRPRSPDLPDGVELTRRQEIRPADILAATKATGQFGGLRYGVLAAFEDDTGYIASDDLAYRVAGRDFGALRLLYEDSQGAAYRGIGWISTLVAHPEADAAVHGADIHYFATSGHWNLNGQLLYSDRDESGAGKGLLADVAYAPRQGIRHSLEVSVLDDGLDINDLGFQLRNDASDFQYRFRWNRSGLQRVRNFELTQSVRYEENGAGLRTNNFITTSANVTLNSLATITGFVGFAPRRYDDRNSFGNGTFSIRPRIFTNLSYRSNTSRPLSFFARVGTRPEAVYGTSLESEFGLSWRPRDNLGIEVDLTHNDRDGWLLHQADGRFTGFQGEQWQPRIGLEFYPSARQQLTLTAQWVGIRATEERFFTLPEGTLSLVEGPKPDAETDDFSIGQLNFQLRYRWQIAPLSDLYVVYTRGDNRRTDLASFGDLFDRNWQQPLGDQLVVKLRYRIGS